MLRFAADELHDVRGSQSSVWKFTNLRLTKSFPVRQTPKLPPTALIFLATASLLFGQVSPEEHARHHPGQAEATPGGSPAQSPGPGMMEGMGEMMRGMHGTAPKELYPSLMALPTLSAEQRQQVE